MAEPFIGQIIYTGFDFAPRGYALCNGQILPIAKNTALFTLLGTQYGGNGQTTFALPDLRGRVSINQGQGPGLPNHSMGQVAGAQDATLDINQLPAHDHLATASGIQASNVKATLQTPVDGSILARCVDDSGGAVPELYLPAGTATNVTLGGPPTVTIGNTGGSQPFSIMQPYLTISASIALEGIFPSRN